jgi:hypothetical protein
MIRDRQEAINLRDVHRSDWIAFDLAHRNPVGEVNPAYRPAGRWRQPHWQLLSWQRHAFFWHPQEQVPQSQVPQQLAFALFCKLVFFESAIAGLLCMPARHCAVTEADARAAETLQSRERRGNLAL